MLGVSGGNFKTLLRSFTHLYGLLICKTAMHTLPTNEDSQLRSFDAYLAFKHSFICVVKIGAALLTIDIVAFKNF